MAGGEAVKALRARRLLQARLQKIRRGRPRFLRYLWWKFWKFERREYWRKPKGIDNKMRLQLKGYPPIVKVKISVSTPYGQATGAGTYARGQEVKVSVTPALVDHGNGTRRVFEAWYLDGEKLCGETACSFTAEKPATATAKYRRNTASRAMPATAIVATRIAAGPAATTATAPTAVTEKTIMIKAQITQPTKETNAPRLAEPAMYPATRPATSTPSSPNRGIQPVRRDIARNTSNGTSNLVLSGGKRVI